MSRGVSLCPLTSRTEHFFIFIYSHVNISYTAAHQKPCQWNRWGRSFSQVHRRNKADCEVKLARINSFTSGILQNSVFVDIGPKPILSHQNKANIKKMSVWCQFHHQSQDEWLLQHDPRHFGSPPP